MHRASPRYREGHAVHQQLAPLVHEGAEDAAGKEPATVVHHDGHVADLLDVIVGLAQRFLADRQFRDQPVPQRRLRDAPPPGAVPEIAKEPVSRSILYSYKFL